VRGRIPAGWGLAAAGGALVLALILFITLRSYNPNALGIMPGPVQTVLNTPTLSGHDIAVNILTITGNQSKIGKWNIPGEYAYGPVENEGDNTWYVTFSVPINMKGIIQRLGYRPQIQTSTISSDLTNQTTTASYDDYIDILPLRSQSFDRLYFDPNNHMATFAFKLDPFGQVMNESWDAVAVNS
jgi:hypothetical protein